MKSPIHRWKQFFTYADGREPHWTFDGKPCWLASGVTDKNGKEIYEGDILQIGGGDTLEVIFDDAAFWLGDNDFFLYHFEPSELEIIGHVMEETTNDNRP